MSASDGKAFQSLTFQTSTWRKCNIIDKAHVLKLGRKSTRRREPEKFNSMKIERSSEKPNKDSMAKGSWNRDMP